MQNSSNLNIIIKAIEKASIHLTRDFVELTNLQANPESADRFANTSYQKVKKVLLQDILSFRPRYNFSFSDGELVLQDKGCEFYYKIFAIDGMQNFRRGNSDFTVAVALEQLSDLEDPDSGKPLCAVIFKPIGSEFYYCEFGKGAYFNRRRVRVSKRKNPNDFLIVGDNQNLLKGKVSYQNFFFTNHSCKLLDLANFVAARADMAIFKNNKFLKSFLLLAKEAGAIVDEGVEEFILKSH